MMCAYRLEQAAAITPTIVRLNRKRNESSCGTVQPRAPWSMNRVRNDSSQVALTIPQKLCGCAIYRNTWARPATAASPRSAVLMTTPEAASFLVPPPLVPELVSELALALLLVQENVPWIWPLPPSRPEAFFLNSAQEDSMSAVLETSKAPLTSLRAGKAALSTSQC